MDSEWLKAQFRINPDKNQAQLAKALGLEPPAISKIISGKRQIKAQEYIEMRRFFGLPTDGERAIEKMGSGSTQSYVLEPLSSALREKDADEDQDAWVIPAHVFENRTKAPPEQIKIFSVYGDAMLPDFSPGEQVLVDLSDTKPSPAGEFVLSDGMSHMIRQCEYVPHSDPPQIRVKALNDKYESYILPLQKAVLIGRVLAKLEWRK